MLPAFVVRCHSTLIAALLTLLLSTGTAAGAATTSAQRLPTCTPAHHGNVTADDVQADGINLEDKIRATPIRHSYLGLSFGVKRLAVNVYMRSHRYDSAIRLCARQMHIAKYVHITIHRFSYGQLLHALQKVEDALPDLYGAQLFECSYGSGDYFDIDVYRGATDAQYDAIKHEAKKTHVAFKIHRLTTDAPVPVDL